MLEPEGRQLLLDALRPPAGHELDRAIGTTYSLDLMSLLTAPLAFALFDRESADGRLVADPIALLEAVRRHADRIDVFCQAGQIAVPREHRALLAYLEPSVHEVVPPKDDAIFHPKIWLIRYRGPDGRPTYRMLCLSRNLTFDRPWDTVLLLNGEARGGSQGDRSLSRFVGELANLALRPIATDRTTAIRAFAAELRSVVFIPPTGFDRLAFWPLGLWPDSWPFRGRIDRLLVVSPFLTAGCLSRLARKGARDVIISRPEAFDLLGAQALTSMEEVLVLNPSAGQPALGEEDEESTTEGLVAAVDEAVAEAAGAELSGLHAKLYVADEPYRARVWTGSANATDAAFNGNVELLVELEGPKSHCGIDALVGDRKDGVGLRKLLEAYRPSDEAPRELTAAELLDRHLDEVRRAMARQVFVATVEPADSENFTFRLRITARDQGGETLAQLLESTVVRLRPLTLGSAYFRAPVPDGGIAEVDFGIVSFERLTSFFIIEVEASKADLKSTVAFVVNADLVGAPDDRRERTLLSLLKNRRDLVRFLLLLLGSIGADDLTNAVDVTTNETAPQNAGWLFLQWEALLEPMVRSLASDPNRLDDIHRLIMELDKTEAGRQLLPVGWRDVWDPIWQAREALRTQ